MFLNPWYGSQAGGGVSSQQQQGGISGLNNLHYHHHDQQHLQLSQQQQQHQEPTQLLQALLERLQAHLRPGWTPHATRDGRLYYCNHATQTSSWLPPLENWESGEASLPYGWEAASDKDGKQYFINHVNKTTTYEDPRKDFQDEPPQPRQIDLIRDPEMGFGFVAGSEKPVIVRFVTEGGPSVEKLLPGDQILQINGEDVKKAPRDHVIQLVRSCKDKVTLTVTQPPLDNSARKSAMLSAAKKQRLKANPSRVRFAESVDINGSPSYSPSNFNSSESTTPFMPNVLKVFLENGQTKSFKYDSSTTVGDVLDSLHQKLGIKCPEHFSLVVEHVKSLRRNKLTLLDPKETLTRIAARPGAQHLRCLYRVTFVPRDAYDLLRKDSMAFEYLYLQVNSRSNRSMTPVVTSPSPGTSNQPHLLRSFHSTPYSMHPVVASGLIPSQSTCVLDISHESFLEICSFECRPFSPCLWFSSSSSTTSSSSSAFSQGHLPSSSFLWSRALLSVALCSEAQQEALQQSCFTTVYIGPVQHLYPIAARSVVFFRRPSWRSLGKWVWSYRRFLKLLYQLRFLLYFLSKLKSLGKWALKIQLVAIIVRHIELIMKHLKKLQVVFQAILKWRLVRKLIRQVRKIFGKYLRWNVLWKLLKRLSRKK